MDRHEIREAIAGPASDPLLRDRFRLEIDEDLPDRIAEDLLSDPGTQAAVAPRLQLILTQLWNEVEYRSPRRGIDLRLMSTLNDINGSPRRWH